MTQIDVWYEGDLSTRCIHSDTGTEIRTDAPKDNHGLGKVFSPTDLLAAALGSCILTLMGIAARKLDVDLKGTHATIVKEMRSAPVRRIGRIGVTVRCPRTFAPDVVQKLIAAGQGCPVAHSLHPDIEVAYTYMWGEG